MPSFSVLAADTFPLHTQEIPDLLGYCKKLSPLNRSLLSSCQKRQKYAVFRKVRYEMLGYLKASNDRASQDL